MIGGLVNGDRAEGNARFGGRQGRCLMLAVGIPKVHGRRAITIDNKGRHRVGVYGDRGFDDFFEERL
jgi:hypothetical protein